MSVQLSSIQAQALRQATAVVSNATSAAATAAFYPGSDAKGSVAFWTKNVREFLNLAGRQQQAGNASGMLDSLTTAAQRLQKASTIVAVFGNGASVYTVQSGDTLSGIAKKTLGDGNKWPQLQSLNNIADANRIFPGQQIRIPGGQDMATEKAALAQTTAAFTAVVAGAEINITNMDVVLRQYGL